MRLRTRGESRLLVTPVDLKHDLARYMYVGSCIAVIEGEQSEVFLSAL